MLILSLDSSACNIFNDVINLHTLLFISYLFSSPTPDMLSL